MLDQPISSDTMLWILSSTLQTGKVFVFSISKEEEFHMVQVTKEGLSL